MIQFDSRRMERLFADPPDSYVPVPWWSWTGSLDPVQLKSQLHLMYQQGIREFFIFPLYGMEPEYMGEDYLDRIGMVIDWCRELGMKVWIYDEHNWPSRTAAGLVARNHPEAVAHHLIPEIHPEIGAADAEALMADPSVVHAARLEPDGTAHPLLIGTLPEAAVFDLVVFRKQKDSTVDLTVRGSLWIRGEPGVTDLLSAPACGSFIQEAYEPIAKRFAEHLGETVKGFFTDEPALAPGLPWTEGLAEVFQSRFGYELTPRLHDLVFESETCELTRRDFWSLVSEISSSAFTGQIVKWCERRGLLLTGHMNREETAHSVWMAGDTPSHLRQMHVPGCDLLQANTSFDGPNPWYVLGPASIIKTPKVAASSARFSGRKRVMCEAYGVQPWSRTLADEKRVTDWLIALGVNLINDNSLIFDISGFRKRAISGKHFTQPWWPQAHLLYKYAARLSALCAETDLDTELLVLYPSTTWWTQTIGRAGMGKRLRDCHKDLDATLDVLVRRHWDFEFLFEDVLEQCEIHDGAILTACGAFRCIVLAGISGLGPAAAARLDEFAAQGGTLIVVGPDPEVIGPGDNRKLSLTGAIALPDRSADSFADALDSSLKARLHRSWSILGADAAGVISAARVDGDGRRLLFVANMSPRTVTLVVRWDGEWPVECWDAASGRRWVPPQRPGEFDLTLPQEESVWIVHSAVESDVSQDAPAQYTEMSSPAFALELDEPWSFRLAQPNYYRLQCRLKPDPAASFKAGDKELIPDHCWLEVNWGDAGIELRPEEMQAYWLYAEFQLDVPVIDLQLVADSPEVLAAYLNGEDLGENHQVTAWDQQNRGWNIGGRAAAGLNRLLVKVKTSPYYAHDVAAPPIQTRFVEPLVIRGEFAVGDTAQDGRLRECPASIMPGDWRQQGFPHFVGTGVYWRRFTWNGPEGPALIVCECGRDVVEATLDGMSLGVRAWGPRTFGIRHLSKGEHIMELMVSNTLGSLLRRTYGASHLHPSPPCGLMSPPRVISVGG